MFGILSENIKDPAPLIPNTGVMLVYYWHIIHFSTTSLSNSYLSNQHLLPAVIFKRKNQAENNLPALPKLLRTLPRGCKWYTLSGWIHICTQPHYIYTYKTSFKMFHNGVHVCTCVYPYKQNKQAHPFLSALKRCVIS